MTVNQIIRSCLDLYGDGSDGTSPTAEQWTRVLDRDPAKPLALINFFKFREAADYPNEEEASGAVAFQRYADVSIPTMASAGGEFLLVAPFGGTFLGKDEDWDLVAIGSYPDQQAFLDLYTNEDYRAAFEHRTAAVAHQKVLISLP